MCVGLTSRITSHATFSPRWRTAVRSPDWCGYVASRRLSSACARTPRFRLRTAPDVIVTLVGSFDAIVAIAVCRGDGAVDMPSAPRSLLWLLSARNVGHQAIGKSHRLRVRIVLMRAPRDTHSRQNQAKPQFHNAMVLRCGGRATLICIRSGHRGAVVAIYWRRRCYHAATAMRQTTRTSSPAHRRRGSVFLGSVRFGRLSWGNSGEGGIRTPEPL